MCYIKEVYVLRIPWEKRPYPRSSILLAVKTKGQKNNTVKIMCFEDSVCWPQLNRSPAVSPCVIIPVTHYAKIDWIIKTIKILSHLCHRPFYQASRHGWRIHGLFLLVKNELTMKIKWVLHTEDGCKLWGRWLFMSLKEMISSIQQILECVVCVKHSSKQNKGQNKMIDQRSIKIFASQ